MGAKSRSPSAGPRRLGALLANPEVVEQIKKTGIAAKSSTPGELEKNVTSKIAKWKKLIADAGITKLE